jgi:Bacterial Ig domain/Bacterial cadherin-like domain
VRFIAFALAALLLVGATAVLAAGGTHKAAADPPKTMDLGCAKNGAGKLQYVSKAKYCKPSRGELIRFPQDTPVTACQLDKGNDKIYEAKAKLPPPAHPHAVKGMLFIVSGAGKCHAPKYPDSHAVTLPKEKDLKLCAGRRHGTVRVVGKFSKCNDLEKKVLMKKREKPSNGAPTANDQSVSTPEDTNKTITLTGSDPDGDSLDFEIESGPSHGTLSGTPPNVTYNPDADFTGTDSFTFKVEDGHGGSDTGKVTISVGAENDPPVVTTSSGSTPYTENGAGVEVDPGLTVTDADDANLEDAQVTISGGFQSGDQLEFSDQNGIAGTYNSGTGILTLTGSASLADYQTALRSVRFSSTSDSPQTPKTIGFRVGDGSDDSGAAATKDVAVTPVNDAPTVDNTNAALSYTEGDGAKAVDDAVAVADVDSANLTGAVVKIASNFASAEDDLAFTNTANITGSYNDTTGTLTLSGTDTVANYQAALRSITYENSSANPNTSTRTVSFKVTDDGAADSNTDSRNINVASGNTKPIVTTTSGNTAVTEGGAPATIDSGLTTSDPDDTNLESAQVRVSAGFQSGDDLVFVNQSGISGVYNTGTGVLTLTGTASVSDYQAALRSITFSTTNDNPNASKTIEFKVNDGDVDSTAATKGITVTGANDAPTLTAGSGSASFTEGGTAPVVAPALTVSDPDSANLTGAVVSISGNFSSGNGDTLNFVNTANISGVYNSGTGVLTLSGSDTVANYVAALRSITYSNTSDNPSTATRTVSFKVTDNGAADSNTDTRDVTVAAANDAPVVTTSGGNTSYTEGNSGTVIDGALTVTDADDANIESAQVRISSGFESGDDLTFVNTANISGVYNTGTGVLTLTGTDTVANYQAALRSITFDNTVDDNLNSPKTIEFKVNDGDTDSNLATKNITVTGANDAPTLTAGSGSASFTENGTAPQVAPSLTVSDPDSANLSGATVSITTNFTSADGDTLNFVNTANISGVYNSGTGVLTLSGTDTVANYQAALRSITFSNTAEGPSTATRTVSFKVTDNGAADSNTDTRDVTVAGANDAPVVTTSSGSTTYSEGDPATTVDGSLTVTDADDTNIESGQVRISTGFESGDDLVFVDQSGISGVYNTGTGVLTLTGTASKSDYQTALRSIQYRHTGDNPGSSKQVEFKVNDGDVDSNAATKGINITGVNDAPVLTTTAGDLTYIEGDGPVAADNGLTLDDPENDQMQGATVQITGNFVQADDELSFVNTANITGIYNDSTGKLTLSGNDTEANYQAALRAVKYANVNENPSGSKTISFQATDVPGAASNVATRTVNVTNANDAPVVTTSGGNTAYTEGDPATTIDGALTITDADDTNLEGGQVRISSGFQSGDDLVFVNQNGISGVYNTGTGVLTLTGTASVADYQTALRSIQYQTTNDLPSTPKTVEFKVNDGGLDSNLATKNIAITGVNDGPTVNTSGGTASFTEGGTAPLVDSGLTVTDPDSTNLSGATVSITGNFTSADGDTLNFVNTANISGVYNSGTGVLTLSGTDTVANYQAALRSITFSNTSDNPSTATRTVSFQVADDGAAGSNTATRDVTVAGANDAPVVTPSGGDTAYTEGDPATTIDGALNVTDVDDTNLEGGQVRISSGFQSGDDLVFVNQNGISGVYNTGTGVLTLTGTSSVANYQTALRSIQYQSTNNNPVTSKTVEFKVNDGDVDSNTPTKQIVVTPVNSPPAIDATNAALSYTENDPATAVDSGLTVDDPEDNNISGASASITANYQSGQDFLAWTDNNLADSITLDNINSNAQTVVLTGIDTEANYQAALRAVTYQNGSENPNNTTRTVTFSATDTPGNATGSDTRTISVTPVDDPPAAVADSATLLEDAGATSVPVLTNDTDIDGGPKTISSATDPANGTVVLTGGSPGAHTGLTYQPDPNYCNDPPGTTLDTFQYTLNGGSTAFVSIKVTCVNDAPVADDETFNSTNSAVGNTTFVGNDPDDAAPATPDPTDTSPQANRAHKTITADILAGDTDVDGPGPLTVTPETKATNLGGSVTIEPDGDFTYEPPAASSCTNPSDFFDYTVEDSDPSDEKTDVGRVTIALTGCVWYVNNNDATGNSGTAAAPFDTIQQAETASNPATPATIGTVYVQDGNNTTLGYTTGLNMNSGEKLIGEAADLVVGTDTLQTGNSGKRPQLTDALEDVVALDDSSTVKGIEVDPTGANSGIAGASGDTGGGTIDDVRIIDTGVAATAPLFELDSTTGTFNVSNLTVNNTAATGQNSSTKGVRLNSTGLGASDSVVFNPTGTISINTTGGTALDVTSTKLGTSTFDDITASGSSTGGVNLDTTQGTVSLGDGSGTDLSLTTTSGPSAALHVNSHTNGAVTVPSGGVANLSATGGPAADITSASGSNFDLDDVDSLNSANDGINIDTIGTGTFSATSGDITGASGISFDLNGGSGKISYPGNIGNGSGTTAVDITNRSGGTGVNGVTLSGLILDTNDAGGTINVSSNTGGETTLSGINKTANTGASDGLDFTSSDGHTLTLSNGGLGITTTSGKGLEATTSGTLEVSGAANTIDSSSATALNVTNTDIASADLNFDRISAGNATAAADPVNGIVLNNTANASGSLKIAGSGGTCTDTDQTGCTGGTIQNTSGSGMSLTNVPGGVDFTRVFVKDAGLHGIAATSVGTTGNLGARLDNSTLVGNGDASGESGVKWTDVIGTTTLSNDSIVTSQSWNALLSNSASGTQTLSVTNSKFADAVIEDGLQLTSDGTSTMNSTITNNTFSGNHGDGFQHGSLGVPNTNTSVSNTTFSNNTITGSGSTAIDAGLQYGPNGSSVKGHIANNTITDVSVSAVAINSPSGGGAGTAFDATVNNNTIGSNAGVNSGSVDGDGIQVKSPSDGTSKFLVKDNIIKGYDKNGMLLRGSESTNGADTDITAQGNQISLPDPVHSETAILLEAGSSSGDVVDVCADVGGAGALANTFSGTLSPAIIGNFWLSLRFPNSKLKAPGYVGTTFTDRQNYFLGRNTGFSGGTAPYVEDGAQNMTTPSPANCLQPTLPSTG